ncbi:MAG: sugar phosphate isomerase/epimerase [Schwartzia sp.]|nr:sugar phosphate isomerase/epimerase [Lachnospiraceae bacterium]MBR5909923.1 sugar phosphate isomerase/epimerase [Schwartzia sp. (in: firmicutes)]
MKIYEKISGFADEIAQELDVQIEAVSRLGIQYIEMRGVDGNNLIYHSDAKVKEIKQKLEDAGIKLSALGSPLGKIGIEDPFEPHLEEFKRACEIAHRMDTKNIRMFSFYIPEGKEKEYKGKVLDRLGRFADYAGRNDIVLLHENEKGIYGAKAPECLEIMKKLDSDHFRAIFDFANFVQCGQDTLEAYDLLKDYVDYIHVKDARKENGTVVPVGYGDGNVEAILKKLFTSGFDGFLSLEPHLFDFKGFEGLERGRTASLSQSGQALSGAEAFAVAHRALCEVLDRI